MGKSWRIILYVDRFAHKCHGKLQSHCIGNARTQEKLNGSGNVCNMLQNIHRPKLPNLLLRELTCWYFLTSITPLCVLWYIFKLKPLNWCVKRENRKLTTKSETFGDRNPVAWNAILSQPHANTSIQVLFIPETTLGSGDPWKGFVDDDERCIKSSHAYKYIFLNIFPTATKISDVYGILIDDISDCLHYSNL